MKTTLIFCFCIVVSYCSLAQFQLNIPGGQLEAVTRVGDTLYFWGEDWIWRSLDWGETMERWMELPSHSAATRVGYAHSHVETYAREDNYVQNKHFIHNYHVYGSYTGIRPDFLYYSVLHDSIYTLNGPAYIYARYTLQSDGLFSYKSYNAQIDSHLHQLVYIDNLGKQCFFESYFQSGNTFKILQNNLVFGIDDTQLVLMSLQDTI